MKPERGTRWGGFLKNCRCHYGRVNIDPVFGGGSSSHVGLFASWKSPNLPYHQGKIQGAVPASPPSTLSSCLSIPACARDAFRKLWSTLLGYASAILAKPKDVEVTSKTNETETKKPSWGNSESSEVVIKHDHEDSNPSSPRVRKPIGLGDKITALQQLVSPFGKTDTASVLTETVSYIKFLHGQVNLLAGDSYSKANRSVVVNFQNTRGGLDGEERVDLRSRGLCLIPICYPISGQHPPFVKPSKDGIVAM